MLLKCKTISSPFAGKYKKRPLARAVAQACMGTTLNLTLAAPAFPAPADNSQTLEEIQVVGKSANYIDDDSSLTKFTEPLQNIPQSIVNLPEKLLDDRGMDSLNDALRAVPGITLGAGEFSWQGNNPNIRGFSARNDMFIDGIRDIGNYYRDPFNLKTVEVLKGPSSMIFGRGSTGGVINQVSKRPTTDPVAAVHFNAGTDSTLRATADLAGPVPMLGTGTAFRVDLMGHEAEVAERDGGKARRYGIAPSLTFGLGSATQLTLSYLRQASDNTPDYGLPWYEGRPAPVPRDNFYGFDSDYLKAGVDIITAELAHKLNDSVDLHGQFRYGHYSRSTHITEPLIPTSVTTGTPLADITVDRNVFIGNSDESTLIGQADATMRFTLGPSQHTMVSGVEISKEESSPTFGYGIGVPGTSLLNPEQGAGFTATSTAPRLKSDTVSKTLAFYTLDTIKFGEAWQLVAGLRWDRFDSAYTATRLPGPATRFTGSVSTTETESVKQVNKQFSYRAGLVYKPTEAGSIYFSWSTSFNPSAEGLSFISSGRGLGVSNEFLDPEKNRSLEFGAKWELFDKSLVVDGSIFQITKTNARVPDPTNSGFNVLAGEQRVRGISADVNGSLTQRWSLLAGYTYLDGKVVNTVPGAAAPAGSPLVDAPHHSLSLWSTYLLTDRLLVGGGARYISERIAKNTPLMEKVPGYWEFDAMGSFQYSENIKLKVNLTNLTNKEYFDQIHPWHVVPAPGFTAMFAINLTLY